MKLLYPHDLMPGGIRDLALASAIVMRDWSLRTETSQPTRRACRLLMRTRALRWRQPDAVSRS